MKKIYVILLLLMVSSLSAQDTIMQRSLNGGKRTSDMNVTYHRSSWCNLLIYHDDQKYAEEIIFLDDYSFQSSHYGTEIYIKEE